MPYNFAPACRGETIVFGAQSPGRTSLDRWMAFMGSRGIRRVVCLLERSRDAVTLEDMITRYESDFGRDNNCHLPITDYHLCLPAELDRVLRFIDDSIARGLPVVVHCGAGSGRTGLVLAAYLVRRKRMDFDAAYRAMNNGGARRDPLEAVLDGNATEEEIQRLVRG